MAGKRVVSRLKALHSASRSWAPSLVLGCFAWKQCVGSIIAGLQQKMRRLTRNAAADWFALEQVWDEDGGFCETKMKHFWYHFAENMARTESHCHTGILQLLTKLSLWKSCQKASCGLTVLRALLGGRGCFGGFVHYWNGFSKLRRSILTGGSGLPLIMRLLLHLHRTWSPHLLSKIMLTAVM